MCSNRLYKLLGMTHINAAPHPSDGGAEGREQIQLPIGRQAGGHILIGQPCGQRGIKGVYILTAAGKSFKIIKK